MLEEILKLARERGYDVVLYDQPLNASAAGPDWNGVVPAYRKRARALAAHYDVPYVHIERKVALTDRTSPTSSTCSRRRVSSGSRRWRASSRHDARRAGGRAGGALGGRTGCSPAMTAARPQRRRSTRCRPEAGVDRRPSGPPRRPSSRRSLRGPRGRRHPPPVPHRRRGARRRPCRRRGFVGWRSWTVRDRWYRLTGAYGEPGTPPPAYKVTYEQGHAAVEAPGGAGGLRHRLPAGDGGGADQAARDHACPHLSARPRPLTRRAAAGSPAVRRLRGRRHRASAA